MRPSTVRSWRIGGERPIKPGRCDSPGSVASSISPDVPGSGLQRPLVAHQHQAVADADDIVVAQAHWVTRAPLTLVPLRLPASTIRSWPNAGS